jgi:Protein of unknown function (DUF3618)
MTASGRGRKTTIEPPAGPEGVLDGTAPGDEQELREEIEQTREQLGETVEQLVAKTDLRGRARAKAARLTGPVKGSTARARAKAAGRGAGMRSQVAGKTVMARQKTAALGGTAKTQVQARAAPAWDATLEPVRRTAVTGISAAQPRRVPLVAAAAMLIAGYLVVRRWRKR